MSQPSTVVLRVDAARHVISVPPEWSGTLTLSVTYHRGRPSQKILVGRAVSTYLEEQEESYGQTQQKRPGG